ncbi:hypothetical protein GE061_000656 [Apolygus lucorum]|uniref:Copper transport protein ATOX1 n=1 Tax=Apolygus lucorum TaxID=248454 RepID=A0A6A4KK69_APOLU|nr:hypothetical protein GE061_000656 [Apolygus lucorum]
MNVYTFSAEMTCGSCENCVKKVLEKNQQKGVGIQSFSVDLKGKKVTVTGTISQAEITEILNKTGITMSLDGVTLLA